MKKWINKNYNNIYFLSLLIPSLIMLGVWIILKIGPFGNKSMLLVDGLHQYIPFFSEYYDKLINGESLLYSWNTGMGNGFITLWAYYLASPLNLIILFFKKTWLYMAPSLIVTIKIILSSGAFALYLNRKRKNNNDISVVAFSVAYAFSNYVVGYYWNVMWMDVILILPIVILGLEKLIEEKNPMIYTLAMFYSFWSNYYISFMLCIFVCIWYLAYNHKNIKDFITNGIKFAFYSILSAAMAALTLLPSYMGITSTASAYIKMPDIKVFYKSFTKIIETHMALIEPINTQTDDSGTNLYCGIATVFLVVLGLFIKKVSLIKKIKYVLVVLLFICSFNNEFLNYIWHGFHNQYGIPNRFSFLYIFVLLTIAYEVYRHIDLVNKYAVFCLYAFFTVIIIIGIKKKDIYPLWMYLVTLGLLSVYFIIIAIYKNKEMRRKTFLITMSTVMLMETIINAYAGFARNGSVNCDVYFPDSESFIEVTNYLEEKDDGFYRVDMIKPLMLDEAIWHNFKSIGIFGSTVQGDMVKTMNRLGFYTAANEYLYKGATPLTNSILGVKYVLARETDFYNLDFSYEKKVDNIDIYKNDFYLPIGFVVKNISSWDYNEGTLFDVQNNFCDAIIKEKEIFDTYYPNYQVTGTNCEASIENNTITYKKANGNGTRIKVGFSVDETADLYFNLKGTGIREITLIVDNEVISSGRYQSQLFHIGEHEKGTKIELEYTLNGTIKDTGTLTINGAKFNYDAFLDVYNELNKYGIEVKEYTGSSIEGTLTSEIDGTVFTSIPYDEGWTLYIDNEKTSFEKVAGAFIGFPIKKGAYNIRLEYFPPKMKEGIIISVVGWLIFIGIYLLRKRRQHEKTKN